MYKITMTIIGLFFFLNMLWALPDSKNDDTLFVSKTFTPRNSFTHDVEGPAVDREGNIYAVNYQKQSTIGKVTPKGVGSIFVQLFTGSTGNGIRFNSKGDMFIADYTGHNVLRVDMKTLEIEIYAHDDRMNQPNDLAITDNDIIYASDPDWTETGGNIWMIDTTGVAHLIVSGMGSTNGIEVSPDNKTLYVNESDQYRLWAFDIMPDGMVNNRRLLRQYKNSVLDGMRCDSLGNLYVACYNKGLVYILGPQGEAIREVKLIGTKSTNIAFGGPDGKTCYVTVGSNGNLETFRTDTPGRSWVMHRNPSGVRHQSSAMPTAFELKQNYPNPFNPATEISYRLPAPGRVALAVYNALGQKISTLVSRKQDAGRYTVTFNGADLDSGIYLAQLTVNGKSQIRKMTLLR